MALTPLEKKTFRLHIAYSAIEGIILGVLALNEFVFIKSIKGSSYQLGILFQFSVIVYLLLIVANEFLRRIKNKKKLLLITGIITRAPLFLLILFPKTPEMYTDGMIYHISFLAIFLVFYLSTPVVYPLITLFLKSNYAHHHFGRLYGMATALNKLILIITTFVYGLVLDHDHYSFTYIFPIVAVLGIISINLLSRIEHQDIITELAPQTFSHSIRESVRKMVGILRSNRPFWHFELAFMIYGFGYMISIALIILFYEDALNLNYSSVAFYRNGYTVLSILLLPFFGRLLGVMDPRKFGAYTFAALFMALLFVVLTEYFPFSFDLWDIRIFYLLIFFVVLFGIFDAMMALLWYIGSAYFCPREETADYQAVHLALTGIRGIFAPLIGVMFYEWIGFTGAFIIAMVSLLAGIWVVMRSYRREGIGGR
ncbi:MAG: MFS transporter [Bacteroidales bacterium]|nr:MFS transporter [Lentimicrobiaceae bacterium]MDD5694650.1 MFS transporter [Bacteroidales bacterium]